MREGYKTHVSDAKKTAVSEYTKLMKDYPIIGILNLENLPGQQLGVMRKKLRASDVTIVMGKQRLIRRAIENVKGDKKGIEDLDSHMTGMPAMLFTKENPFSLYKLIKKNKSKAPAKAGQTLPADVVVSAGPTSFAPGPIISELAAFKIKTKVENGKLTITDDVVVAQKGEVVSDKLASMLLRLDLKPMEIGLDLVAIYENGTVFTRDVLDIDEDQFLAEINDAARWAFNLAVEVSYPTADTLPVLIGKVVREGRAVALASHFPTKDTINDLLGKAHREMLSVSSVAGL